MSDPATRPATPADNPAITRIYAHAVRHGTASFELEPPAEQEMLQRQRALLDGGYPYLAAEIDGVLAGYAYAGAYRARPAYRFSVEDSVYVDPAMHKRGIGRLLLSKLIEEAERRGFRQMIAVIGDSAQTPSIELHRALGFEWIGPIKNVGFKHGKWLDTVLMQRALGEGATTDP
jgi:phosphinothricin acetyltransferase